MPTNRVIVNASPIIGRYHEGDVAPNRLTAVGNQLIPDSNRDAVIRLDFHHPSAPHPHPAQNENGQVIENLPASNYLVPKRGLEPLQVFTY